MQFTVAPPPPTRARGLSLTESIQLDFAANMASFDAGIATWNQKRKWDAVRPFSAIEHHYGRRPIRALGGPGKGTVDRPANQWREYLNAAGHPEYPSGTATFCAAQAQVARRFLNTETLNLSIPALKGSSRIEPGITPATDIVIGPYPTWTDFERECAESRIWGGVHFRAAVEEGLTIGRTVANVVWPFIKSHIDGTAPPPSTRPR